MARLVAAFASSHSVMLTSTLEDWQMRFLERDRQIRFFDQQGNPCTYEELEARAPANADALVTPDAIAKRYADVQAAMLRLKKSIADARLDALIICGDDQHELLDEQLMPSIGIYYGKTIANGARPDNVTDWYVQAQNRRLEEKFARDYPCDQPLALHLIEGLLERGFDPATMSGLADGQCEGHAFSFMHRVYLDERPVPIVPVFLNTFYPPNQPSPARCLAFGEAMRDILAEYPADARIGFMASGGLSHFHADAYLDHEVIDALRRHDKAALAALDAKRLQSGSSEIRSWIVLGGIAPDLELDWVSYTPGYRTRALTGTGLAFASWVRNS